MNVTPLRDTRIRHETLEGLVAEVDDDGLVAFRPGDEAVGE